MSGEFRDFRAIDLVGWEWERLAQREPLPSSILARYPRIPAEYVELIETTGFARTKFAWLVSARVLSGAVPNLDYRWNEWELMSLEAAEGDEGVVRNIVEFWDRHLVIFTVKPCYAYFALDLDTLQVVNGEESDFEDPSPLAEMFELIASADPSVALWL